MPTGPVYQPTTVTYEQQPSDQRWNCPISYFSRRVTSSLNRAVCIQLGLLLLGGIILITGISLLTVGAVQHSDATSAAAGDDGVGLLVAGGVLTALGALITGLGAWARSRRWGGGKEVNGGGAAALTALNPSTDPLVAGQYVPVRDAPPAPDDETRNLMDKDKECLSSAEESDKMLDGRPQVA